jgi:hypothetical protein
MKKNRLIIGSIIVLMSIIVVLSGRRALFVSTILSLITVFLMMPPIITKNHLNKTISFSVIAIAIGLIASLVFLNFYGHEYYLEQIRSIFDFSDNQSNLLRAEQFDSLLKGIYDSPIFGSGAGAVASCIRSDTQPWAYELSYIAFIFHYGLLGFTIFSLGVIVLLLNLFVNAKKQGIQSFEFAFLTGMIAFLIANASNPYLEKFDYMWIIFIPYALLNQRFLDNHKMNQ